MDKTCAGICLSDTDGDIFSSQQHSTLWSPYGIKSAKFKRALQDPQLTEAHPLSLNKHTITISVCTSFLTHRYGAVPLAYLCNLTSLSDIDEAYYPYSLLHSSMHAIHTFPSVSPPSRHEIWAHYLRTSLYPCPAILYFHPSFHACFPRLYLCLSLRFNSSLFPFPPFSAGNYV